MRQRHIEGFFNGGNLLLVPRLESCVNVSDDSLDVGRTILGHVFANGLEISPVVPVIRFSQVFCQW